ncbi:hypothetical protein [Arthrobacter crystallopoietes]|jgi:hypothetical protein|uniref:hypothetical protein n=1 Tax=Crystallibacter crystallopoietes TaxID=37928 RepID=UPI00148738B6|nr:hypothetical protein [Arthrobacter crystallopoietes]
MASTEEIKQKTGDREHALGVTEPAQPSKDSEQPLSEEPLDEDQPTGHLEATPETD